MKHFFISTRKRHKISILFVLFLLTLMASCNKKWLEAKSDITLTVPENVKDLQALLDNSSIFNTIGSYVGLIGTDELLLKDAVWTSQSTEIRNTYIWKENIFEESVTSNSTWNLLYNRVLYANIVLDRALKIDIDMRNKEDVERIRASALFFRALAHYEVAQLFAPYYKFDITSEQQGIPLRTSSDFNVPLTRATLKDTYNHILNDLHSAISYLPRMPNTYKTQPSKAAAHALLARIYLSIEDYSNALLHSDSSLAINKRLINYTDLNSVSANPMPLIVENEELLFLNSISASTATVNGGVDTVLYQLYDENDLRKSIFFSGNYPDIKFKGNYNSLTAVRFFNGLATDEQYLIRAECYARKGEVEKAVEDYNVLIKARWNPNSFVPLVESDPEVVLSKIILERRKELVFRNCIRWSDLKRLNNDNRYKTTLSRKLYNQTYTLPPNDLRYVLLIPPDVIRMSNIPQNPR